MASDQIRTLTIWPEWAACIALHGKRIENRPRAFPRTLSGQRIALHAGRHVGGRPGRVARNEARKALRETGLTWLEVERAMRWVDDYAGHLFATCEVRDPLDQAAKDQRRWCVEGQVWNPLHELRLLDPPEGPIRGAQGFWRAPMTTQLRRHVADGGS